jgi:hypothetical protein
MRKMSYRARLPARLLGLLVVALLVASCTGATLNPTRVSDSTATLSAVVTCKESSCYSYHYYIRWGLHGQALSNTTAVTAPDRSVVSKLNVSETLSGLTPDTTYDFQVCRRGDGVARPTCVGADGNSTASASFRTTARPLPADTTSGIHLFQPFNYNERVANGIPQGEAGLLDYVWGANQPPGGLAVWHESYVAWGTDPEYRSVAWWRANHPTSVMYKADRRSVAIISGQTTPVLDMTNPAVQAMFTQRADSALLQGFNGISWDNTPTYNVTGAAGHYDSTGRWVQQYSGELFDSVYAQAQGTALTTVVTDARNVDSHASHTVNQRFQCNAAWSPGIASADMVLDEGGFTMNTMGDYVTTAPGQGCGNEWGSTVYTYEALQTGPGARGIAVINEEPYTVTSYMTRTGLRARADLQYALANYLLIKHAHTYFWWGGRGQYGGPPSPQSEYTAPIGSPEDRSYPAQGVYMRDYSNGLVLVNPDPTKTTTVALPRSYRDLYGNRLARVAMPPHSGEVLLNGN